MPVGDAEHSLSYRQSRRAVAESGDYSGQLVAGDRRCSVTVAAIGPGRGPRQLSCDVSRRMNLNDDVVYRCLRLGPLHQLHSGRSRSLLRHRYRLHRPPPCVWYIGLTTRRACPWICSVVPDSCEMRSRGTNKAAFTKEVRRHLTSFGDTSSTKGP